VEDPVEGRRSGAEMLWREVTVALNHLQGAVSEEVSQT
jgi:hypothetical protein